jgi:large subunit ribosomal protein L35
MPKMKTHSGAKDRIKVTKKNKVIRGNAGTNHFLQKKSASRKRRLAVPSLVDGKIAKNIKKQLGQ